MTLAASGVAETGVLPVEVLIKLAPLSIQMPAAREISAAFSITPVSQNDFGRMFFAGNFTYQGNEVGTGLIIAGKKVPVRKDGVDFHGALFERVFRFGTDFAQVAAAVGEVDDRGQV